jgi:hypothetical protein
MNAAGLLTQETFARGKAAAAEEFKKNLDEEAAKVKEMQAALSRPMNVGAATRGTMAGFSAVIQGENEGRALLNAEHKAQEERKRQTALLEEIRRINERMEGQERLRVVSL